MTDGPIVSHVYTADPSAHVFKGKLYVYPSHDIDAGIEDNDNGDQYAMNDYHVFSMDTVGGPVTDHGVVLSQKDIPWVSKQLWAPDAAEKNGKYYLYFPARDKDGIFRIGVAEGSDPAGPFKPDADYIKGSYSIDPASFVDDDGSAYLYMGGIWGGQLQCWQEKGKFDDKWSGPQEPKGEGVYALSPIVAKLNDDMHSLVEEPKEVEILAPETGKRILADDHDRRFFEAAWLHKYKGRYYFSYSTGDTHYLAYATGTSPYGPFTYEGRILEPVEGWTTHHSIVEYQGRWFLFHHDSSLSGGKNHLRSVKIKEIFYDDQGRILPAKQS
ncbi:hypothetical protein CAC42_6114 [Sphaceloma murrayae]|uniref:Xylosidase/arabinosidase n=1 Tax=Sphaceloma murrayae TaxID=2082308 RepID=A0A2K1QVH6_9PEZI|nr:hypothetical protein CAC42_6114 [Sphaceloma murrayae]